MWLSSSLLQGHRQVCGEKSGLLQLFVKMAEAENDRAGGTSATQH